MDPLYWLIAGLGALVLVVLAVAVTDVLRTANRGRVHGTPHADLSEVGPTDATGVLSPDTVQRLNGEAYTQPLYRPHRRRGSSEPSSRRQAEPNRAEPTCE
jgi:hypothetical protein